ncbi:MAG: hypothetical protein HQ446_02190, partial [Polaromonas sp.]|nr:hypothetical protein [Polaromonas sp.]
FGVGHVIQADEALLDYSGNLPEGLSLDNNLIEGVPTVAGFTWLEQTQADAAGNTATTYYQLAVTASTKTGQTSVTINNIDPEKAVTYVGTEGDDVNLNLYKSIGDVVFGMGGNDVFKLPNADSLGFAYIDGGQGIDQLRLSISGLALDLADFNNRDGNGQMIQHIEDIYMSGTGASLSVSAHDIFALNSDLQDVVSHYDMLKITGMAGGGREVSLSDLTQVGALNGFTETGAATSDTSGLLFSKFEGAYTDSYETQHWVTLLVEKGLFIA